MEFAKLSEGCCAYCGRPFVYSARYIRCPWCGAKNDLGRELTLEERLALSQINFPDMFSSVGNNDYA